MDGRCPISYWFDFTIGCSCFLLKKSISFFLKKKSRKEGNIFEAQIKLDIGKGNVENKIRHALIRKYFILKIISKHT